jgi:hypothetical protein
MFRINVSSISAPRRLARLGARSIGLSAAVAALAGTVAPAAALAAGCPSVPLSQPFSSFGDASYYELVSGGDFEGSLTGWTQSGVVQQASGSESYGVTGVVGNYSLALAAGASAQSPYMCVDESYRSFRFFTKTESGTPSVAVAVVYQTPNGPYVKGVGTVKSGSSWAPTAKMPTYAGPASSKSGGMAQVAIRFSVSKGTVRVDDLFIDPRMR